MSAFLTVAHLSFLFNNRQNIPRDMWHRKNNKKCRGKSTRICTGAFAVGARLSMTRLKPYFCVACPLVRLASGTKPCENIGSKSAAPLRAIVTSFLNNSLHSTYFFTRNNALFTLKFIWSLGRFGDVQCVGYFTHLAGACFFILKYIPAFRLRYTKLV